MERDYWFLTGNRSGIDRVELPHIVFDGRSSNIGPQAQLRDFPFLNRQGFHAAVGDGAYLGVIRRFQVRGREILWPRDSLKGIALNGSDAVGVRNPRRFAPTQFALTSTP